jgi:PAS domain S-box-containing protein
VTDRRRKQRPPHTSNDAPFANEEERYRRLVDSVKDYAILMIDPEGLVITWNKNAERIKGYPSEEIIGRHFCASTRQRTSLEENRNRSLRMLSRQGDSRIQGGAYAKTEQESGRRCSSLRSTTAVGN